MLSQDPQVSWDVRSLLYAFWPWAASLVAVVAVIGLAIYVKLQRSRQVFAANSNSCK